MEGDVLSTAQFSLGLSNASEFGVVNSYLMVVTMAGVPIPAGWSNSGEAVDWVGIEDFGDESFKGESQWIWMCPSTFI